MEEAHKRLEKLTEHIKGSENQLEEQQRVYDDLHGDVGCSKDRARPRGARARAQRVRDCASARGRARARRASARAHARLNTRTVVQFGIMLGLFWNYMSDHFATIFGLLWVHFGIILE